MSVSFTHGRHDATVSKHNKNTTRAVIEVAAGSLRREVLRKEDGLLAKGETLTGKIALRSLHQRFKLESGALTQVEKSKLMSLGFESDHELHLDNLDAILATIRKELDDDLWLALLEPQLRTATHLSHECVFHDTVGPDSPQIFFRLWIRHQDELCSASELSLCEIQ